MGLRAGLQDCKAVFLSWPTIRAQLKRCTKNEQPALANVRIGRHASVYYKGYNTPHFVTCSSLLCPFGMSLVCYDPNAS